MNDGFKQRLVGAIVLGSLVLILWPVVFSKATGPALDRRSQIPVPPLFEKYTIAKPQRPANIDPIIETPMVDEVVENTTAQGIIEAPTANKATDKKAEAKTLEVDKSQPISSKPVLDQKGLPKSWVLQVASFEKQSNAKELKIALQKKGYKAYTRRVKTPAGESVRVYVGPKLIKSAFAKDKKAIDKAFNVKSMVVRFYQ